MDKNGIKSKVDYPVILGIEDPSKELRCCLIRWGILKVSGREDDSFEALEIFNGKGVLQMNSKTQEVNMKGLS
jgi:hypothetical protein